MPAYFEDLKAIIDKGCQTPSCQHKHDKLFVVARCHPKAPIHVIIIANTETMVIRCAECQNAVVEIKIARRGNQALVGL